ncbi:MAG: hypothetical protein KDF65_05825 [Anaerolineae bacterium]|nr:hypothetical protein [Anaerolineae bacterium]
MPTSLNPTDIETLILASIDQRYQAQARRDLADYVFANYLFHAYSPAFLEFAYQYRQEIVAYLAEAGHVTGLVDYCIRATKSYTYQRNQFINFTRFYDELLAAEYHDFLSGLRAALAKVKTKEALADAFGLALRRHHERLRLILSSYCLAYQPTDLLENPLLKTVPCEEYSASFQLRLLGLEITDLVEPILDVGCGAGGRLVEQLIAQGYAAFGLDRLVPPGPHFFAQDWFAFDYGQKRWGTIIAHQSFSTHFIHAHLHHSANTEQFARTYMRLLAGLKAGGSFCYAPGLPFFEESLAQTGRYTLTKTTIAADRSLGIGEIFYAMKVTPLA